MERRSDTRRHALRRPGALPCPIGLAALAAALSALPQAMAAEPAAAPAVVATPTEVLGPVLHEPEYRYGQDEEAEASPDPQRPRPGWQGPALALGDERLERMRGGFQTPQGLQLSFGIERLVYINGTLATSTRIAVQGLGAPGGAVPEASLPPGGSLSWVLNGAAQTLAPGLPAGANLGTVIQNSLNDQHIQTLTIINANANSLDVLRSWSLQLSIRDAVAGSVRR